MSDELNPDGTPNTEALESRETVGTGNDARVAMLERINDELDGVRGEELANVNDDGSTEPFQASPPTSEDESPTGEPATPAEEPAVTEPRKFTIKVNGKELQLTEEELIARAQKVESADEYLRAAKQPAPTAPEPVVPKPSREELQRLQDEEDRALVRAIQMGTEDEATAALRKIREQSSTRLSPDDVSRTVDERLAFKSAIEKFNTDYKDIVSDPYLHKLARDRDSELLAAGDSRPYGERYEEIGKGIRDWVTKFKVDVQPAASDLKAKEVKKAAAPKVPTSASAKRAAPVADDDNDESPSDVIQAMREKRGGPQWMRN